MEDNRKKQNLLLILSIFVIIGIFGGLTYAFFNYTKTGDGNVIKTGRMSFISNQTNTISLQNIFPVKASELSSNLSSIGTNTITISGDTLYSDGIEYLVSIVDVNNKVNGKTVPIKYNVSYVAAESKTVGQADNNYFDNRGGENSLYQLSASGNVKEDERLVVGYIASGASGIGGTITINAYLDGDKIAISDTYDGTESESMGTTSEWVNGRVVLTTTEWNNLQTSGVSFKVKVEANEGIWVSQSLRASVQTLYLYNDEILSLSDKSQKKDIEVKFNDASNNTYYAKLSLQGTSSLTYDKKNYTITFYADDTYTEKMNVDVMKGWGGQSKYCLKANWIDSTQARNIVSARLVAQMQSRYNLFMDTPNNGVVDGFFVEVYINDEYQGLYTMNIPKDAWMFNMDEDNPNHIVMAAENPLQGTATTFEALSSTTDGVDFSIEVGPNSNETETLATFAKLNRLIAFVKDSTNEYFKAHLAEYLNLDALLNYYCFIALSNAVDNMSKNMLLVTYDGNIWYPNLYDMDGTWGLLYGGDGLFNPDVKVENYVGGSSLLFKKLLECYPAEVQQRYNELRAYILSNEHILSEFNTFLGTATQEMWDREHTKWTDIPSASYGISQITQHVIDRGNYIDSKMYQLYHAPVNYSDNRIIYKLESPFIGAKYRFWDTGINLYKTNESDQHASIFIRYKTNVSADSIMTVFSNRSSDYENPSGFTLRNAFDGTDGYSTYWAGDYQYEAVWNTLNTQYVTIAMTINGNVYHVYNGSTSSHSTVTSSTTKTVSNNVVIGADYYDDATTQFISNEFDGEITDFIIYNSVLTENEISSIMASLN